MRSRVQRDIWGRNTASEENITLKTGKLQRLRGLLVRFRKSRGIHSNTSK